MFAIVLCWHYERDRKPNIKPYPRRAYRRGNDFIFSAVRSDSDTALNVVMHVSPQINEVNSGDVNYL